jgi:ArsR family transcriptional regulator
MTAIAEKMPATGDLDDVIQIAKAVGDRLRAGVLKVMHQDSYSVSELCTVFGVPQPALSHHLKILLNAGLVARRREGNSIFYRRASLPEGSAAAGLFRELDGAAVDSEVAARIDAIHADRNRRSVDFFRQNAREITARQAEISEPGAYADVVQDMLTQAIQEGMTGGRALEVGPGSGVILSRLSEIFDEAVGVDSSRTMLDAAGHVLGARDNVSLEHEDFHALPDQRRYDAIVAAMVLHHQASPAAFFARSERLLNEDGALVIVELCHHDQEWAREACGDQWLGFEPEELEAWAAAAGFASTQSQYLAQKNGFQVQIHHYQKPSDGPKA